MAADEGPVSIPPGVTTGPRPILPRAGLFNGGLHGPGRSVGSRVSGWSSASSKPRSRGDGIARRRARGRPADGDVVLVRGELGSGKTTLVRGAARALGVSDPVTSPTFSIGHRYRAPRGDRLASGPLPARRARARGSRAAGDYLGAGRIAFVEWPAGRRAELRERAPARHAQPSRRRPPRSTSTSCDAVTGRDDRARLRHRHARHRRRAAPRGRAHAAKRATTPRPGAHPGHATRLLEHGRRAARATRASAGARSTGSPSASGRARSRACASGSPPRAGSRSRCRPSSSASRACRRSRRRRSPRIAPTARARSPRCSR